MDFKINLATKTYIDTVRLNTAIVAGVVLLVVVLFFQVSDIGGNAGEIKRLARETSEVAPKGEFNEKEYQALLKRIRFANDIIARKTYGWLALLDRLEAVMPEGISLYSIEPNQKEQTLKISAVAKGFGQIRQLMENLEGSKDFTEVYLLSQSDVKGGEHQSGTAFSVACKVNVK